VVLASEKVDEVVRESEKDGNCWSRAVLQKKWARVVPNASADTLAVQPTSQV